MQTQALDNVQRFQLVCANCGGLGVAIDDPANAPSETVVNCRHCGAPRGTLEQLRPLSLSASRDHFEV